MNRLKHDDLPEAERTGATGDRMVRNAESG